MLVTRVRSRFCYHEPMMLDELAEHLNALQRDDCYRVDAVLKESPYETTERVYFRGENGAELGPFVRKSIDRVTLALAALTSASGTRSAPVGASSTFRSSSIATMWETAWSSSWSTWRGRRSPTSSIAMIHR